MERKHFQFQWGFSDKTYKKTKHIMTKGIKRQIIYSIDKTYKKTKPIMTKGIYRQNV